MRATEKNCINVFASYENKAPYKQALISLIDKNPTRFLPLHLKLANTRRVTACLLQETDTIGHTQATRTIFDTMPHTPPQ